MERIVLLIIEENRMLVMSYRDGDWKFLEVGRSWDLNQVKTL